MESMDLMKIHGFQILGKGWLEEFDVESTLSFFLNKKVLMTLALFWNFLFRSRFKLHHIRSGT
jgi:hypothetical protein